MATHSIKKNGIHFKIDIDWRPATITTKKGWYIRLSYLCKTTTTWKMIISVIKDNIIAKNNMKKFLEIHTMEDLPEFEDYEKAKEEFFKQDISTTDLPHHVKEYTK